jgi:hypothetical protein
VAPYWDVEVDTHDESFIVYLGEARTRLIRSQRHAPDCVECEGREAIELSLDDIRRVAA